MSRQGSIPSGAGASAAADEPAGPSGASFTGPHVTIEEGTPRQLISEQLRARKILTPKVGFKESLDLAFRISFSVLLTAAMGITIAEAIPTTSSSQAAKTAKGFAIAFAWVTWMLGTVALYFSRQNTLQTTKDLLFLGHQNDMLTAQLDTANNQLRQINTQHNSATVRAQQAHQVTTRSLHTIKQQIELIHSKTKRAGVRAILTLFEAGKNLETIAAADTIVTQVESNSSDYVIARYLKAYAYYELHDYKESIKELEQLLRHINSSPAEHNVLTLLADSHRKLALQIQNTDHEQAERHIHSAHQYYNRATAVNPKYLQAHRGRIILLIQEGRNQEAINRLETLQNLMREISPHDTAYQVDIHLKAITAHNNLLKQNLDQNGDFMRALDNHLNNAQQGLNSLTNQDDIYHFHEIIACTYATLARRAKAKDQHDEIRIHQTRAKDHFNLAIRIKPCLEGYTNYANYLMECNEIAEANELLNTGAMHRRDHQIRAISQQGAIHFFNTFAQAAFHLANSQDPSVTTDKAKLYLSALGHITTAIELLNAPHATLHTQLTAFYSQIQDSITGLLPNSPASQL